MNVLMIHGSLTIGGGDSVYIHQLMRHLSAYSVRADLIAIEFVRPRYTVKTVFAGIESVREFGSIQEVNELIRAHCLTTGVDLIHVHTLYIPEITDFCLGLKPVIKTPHATDLVCPGSYKFFSAGEQICHIPFGPHCLAHAYLKKCCSRSPARLLRQYKNVWLELNRFAKQYAALVVMSEYVKQECIAAGVDEEKIKLIPYFTEPAPSDMPRETTGKSLLFIGRLSQIKGVHKMLDALEPILKQNTDVRLDIVGDGPYRETLERTVRLRDMDSSVYFHGWLDHDAVRTFLSQCYLLVFPSIYPEAFGISGIEAMMHGKPVVAFDVGGVNSWLADGQTGFLVPGQDIFMMRERINHLLLHPGLAEKLGRQGMKIASEKFNVSLHVGQLLDVYENAVQTIKKSLVS